MAGELMAEGPRPADLAIGIDFGGSGIKGAVVDIKTGKFVGDRIRIPTPQPSVPRDVVALMDRLVHMLIEALPPVGGLTPADVAAVPVGVGVPAATRGGVVLTAANIDRAWIGYPAERELALAMGRIVAVGNDADVAGMAGRRQRGTIIVLTIGTGLGTALFADGKLLPNTELGHIELNGGDAELRVAESARDRFNLGWKEWASGFDAYLHALERLFWPDLFILGGGASKRADNYLQYLTVTTPVVVATMKNNAGIVGGALLAYDRRLRETARAAAEPIA